MEFKFAHIADIHARESNWDEISECLTCVQRVCREQKIQFTIIAGDLWDHKLWAHSESFRGTVDWVVRMATYGPVYILYGTPSHDVPGSHEIFKHVEAANPINVLSEVSTEHVYINDDTHETMTKVCELAVLPHKIIAPEGDLEQTMATRRAAIEKYVGYLKEDPSSYPRIFIGHLAVVGCVIPQGTDGYEISPVLLKDFDYAALGHIHPKDQKLPSNIQYSGSLWHTETGDTSEKGFYIITMRDKNIIKKEFINAGSHPVIKLDGHFTEKGVVLPNAEAVSNAKVRFTVYIPAKFRDAFNTKNVENDILARGAYSCKVVPRVLQEDIEVVDFGYTRDVKPGDWKDKFAAYCEVSDIEVTEDVSKKVDHLIKEVGDEYP